MTKWYTIFSILISKKSGTFPKRCLKLAWRLFIPSGWVRDLNLDLFVDFLPLITLRVFGTRADRLLAAKDLMSRSFPGCIQHVDHHICFWSSAWLKHWIYLRDEFDFLMAAFAFKLTNCDSILFDSQGMFCCCLGFKYITSHASFLWEVNKIIVGINRRWNLIIYF